MRKSELGNLFIDKSFDFAICIAKFYKFLSKEKRIN